MRTETLPATVLLDDLANGDALLSIPNLPGLYFWRLSLFPPAHLTDEDARGWKRHVDRLSRLPQGRASGVRVTHSLTFDGLVLGGTGLPNEKSSVLGKLLDQPNGVGKAKRILQALQDVVPALYAGEAKDLRVRLKQHLNGETEFASQLAREEMLTWSDLAVSYLVLGQQPSTDTSDSTDAAKVRKAFEYLAAELTIATYTKRPG